MAGQDTSLLPGLVRPTMVTDTNQFCPFVALLVLGFGSKFEYAKLGIQPCTSQEFND